MIVNIVSQISLSSPPTAAMVMIIDLILSAVWLEILMLDRRYLKK